MKSRFISVMMRRLFFFLASAMLLLTACSDNDSFTTDRSSRLTFSRDTVQLDTLFSAVPSVTYTFWIYNRASDGLRISTARLEKGNQTGFRVNIDGTFLNPVGQNFEIRQGDSLRVFVEITSYENHAATPQLVEDNLLLTLESGVEQRVNLRTYSWDAEKLTSLVVARDTTIESSKPLVLYGDGITVAPEATLTLKNCTLYFHSDARLLVEGRLVAEGCLFRGDRLDHMFAYLPYDRVSGQWRGIQVVKDAEGCFLTDSEVRSAWDGIVADSTVVSLTNTVVHNNRGYGLYAADSDVQLYECLLSNAEADCLALHGSTAVVDQCTLAQFYPLTANRGAALRFTPTDDHPSKLTCTNTLMTGYADDVMTGLASDGETSFYQFSNCLIRTPEITGDEGFTDILWETPKDEFQGTQHFLLVDGQNLIYDFTIKQDSPAYEPHIGRSFEPQETPNP